MYLVFDFDVVMLNRVSDVNSAEPDDNTTGWRAFRIQDTCKNVMDNIVCFVEFLYFSFGI